MLNNANTYLLKILNNMIDLDSNKFFKIAPVVTRGLSFKLLKISECNYVTMMKLELFTMICRS